VEAGIGRGIYGREALNINPEAETKNNEKNFRIFEETITILKKAGSEKFFDHKGEFYTYCTLNFEGNHSMSLLNEEFMDIKTKILKKLRVVLRTIQKLYFFLWQVVESNSSIEGAEKNNINTIMWNPTVKTLKKRFEVYKKAKSKIEKRNVEMGEGKCLVREMFLANSMEEAKEKAGEKMKN
jgi:Luciferase-like monooxygenase.